MINYAQIQPNNQKAFPIRKINQELKRKNQQFTNSPLLSRTDDKTAITQKQAQLKEYKD